MFVCLFLFVCLFVLFCLWFLFLLFLFVGGMNLFFGCCFFRVRVCMRVDFKINTFVKVMNLYILRLLSTF